MKLSNAAQVAIAFGIHDLRGIRAAASVVLSRYAYELARDGETPSEKTIRKLCQRFRLGDYFATVHQAYKKDIRSTK